MKKEKNIKAEEEDEDSKKKEKVMPHLTGFLLCFFLFVLNSLNLRSGPTFIFGRTSCQEEGSRGSRGKGKMSIAIV